MRVEHLCKRFGEHVVLDDLTLEFPKGQISCLMGASGKGKTTLLHILLGLVQADGGEITDRPESLAACFQTDRLCDALSAVENVRFVTGKRVPRETIEAHLTRLGLRESMEQPVSELSGGMRRRVCLARAVLSGAEAIFLDEPFKGLDEDTRRTAMDYLKETCAGKTLVVVTHEPAEAEDLGGTILHI